MTMTMTIDYIGLAVVLLVLIVLNFRFLKMWVGILQRRETLNRENLVLPGGRGWIIIGGILLTIGVIEKLLEGDIWYLGLVPISWSVGEGKLTLVAPLSLLGYLILGLGLAQVFLKRKDGAGANRG